MDIEREKQLKRDFPNVYRNLYRKPKYNVIQRLLRLYFSDFKKIIKYNKLRSKFSFLPPVHYPQHSIELFGLECGDGWYDLIYNLSGQIEDLVKKLPRKQRKHFHVDQIKEKFGTLRFYMRSSTDEMEDQISKAEDISAKTCETCGSPGKTLSTGGWWYTSCEKHKR